MRRILREPLLHFLLLGAALFVLYGRVAGGRSGAPDEIVVDAARIASLAGQFERTWQRPPTAAELDGLIQGYVREEVLYREGLALGLDRDDPVIRRRVGQKIEFIADGAAPEAPSDAELEAWLAAHLADYAVEPRYGLRQVYFDPGRRGASLEADLAAAREALVAGADPEAAALGDATLLPATLEGASTSAVARVFGPDFAEALAALPVGSWQGPVRSGYGLHLVQLTGRAELRAPSLDEVRPQVERDFLHARSIEAGQAFYEKLRARYRIRIDTPEASASAAARPR